MFDYLYDWIQNIGFYMVMVTAVMHIVPNQDYKRYIRFFTGLILVVMLAAPFLKLLGMKESWQDLYASRTYQEQVEKMEEALQSFRDQDTWNYQGGFPVKGQEGTPANEGAEDSRIDVEEIKVGR